LNYLLHYVKTSSARVRAFVFIDSPIQVSSLKFDRRVCLSSIPSDLPRARDVDVDFEIVHVGSAACATSSRLYEQTGIAVAS
jgi:hypothetical protein